MRPTWKVAALAVVLLVAGCARAPGGGAGGPVGSSEPGTAVAPSVVTSPDDGRADERSPIDVDAPPPVTIRWEDRARELAAWTYCYGNVCADGMPPDDPFDVGSPDRVTVDFPLDDWSFTATFREVGTACPRVHHADLVAGEDGTHLLEPVGRAGTWDVTLEGRGDGDLFTSFRWTTPRDGPVAGPEARVAVLADHDGRLDSYGVELELRQLADTPEDAVARIVVRDAVGEELATIAPPRRDDEDRAGDGDDACLERGRVYWQAEPAATGRSSTEWGEVPPSAGPFTYEVEVVLDGTRHVATATWPDDELADFAPSVPLTFTPPLPGLAGAAGDGGRTTAPSGPSPTGGAMPPVDELPTGEVGRVGWLELMADPDPPGADCAYRYPDDLADRPIAFDGTIVGIERGGHDDDEAAGRPVDLHVRVEEVFAGDLPGKVTVHTWDFVPKDGQPWDPVGQRLLAAMGESMELVACGFTRPHSVADADDWRGVFGD